MQGDSIRVMLLVTDVLEKMGIPYAVGGSLSSSVHGVMRSTLDVDIIAMDLHVLVIFSHEVSSIAQWRDIPSGGSHKRNRVNSIWHTFAMSSRM